MAILQKMKQKKKALVVVVEMNDGIGSLDVFCVFCIMSVPFLDNNSIFL